MGLGPSCCQFDDSKRIINQITIQPATGRFKIGILQIKLENKTLYGIGVCVYADLFITLTRYFVRGAKLSVFTFDLSTQNELVRFPITDRNGLVAYDVVETNINSSYKFGTHRIFMKLKLKLNNQTLNFENPSLLHRMQIKNSSHGFAIGIPKYTQLKIQRYQFPQVHISKLRLNYSAALIFIKAQGVRLYGFYDGLNNFGKEDYYLRNFGQQYLKPSPLLSINFIDDSEYIFVNQAYIANSPQLQQPQTNRNFPYCSIGLLLYEPKKIVGTATMLFDKKRKTCKYIITCAHNFFNYMKTEHRLQDYCDDKNGYKLGLPRQEILEQPDRYMAVQEKKFRIKEIYVPDQYKRQMNNIKNATGSTKYYNMDNAFKNSMQFDIAIVQLQQQIDVDKGFRISLFQRNFDHVDNIQVTGFPKTSCFHTLLKKQYTSSTSDYTGRERPVEIVNISGQKRIKHKLSTLPGNSGSPIYQFKKINNAHYLFGVHTIAGKQSDPVRSSFLRLGGTLNDPIFGQGFGKLRQFNWGTYLYNKNIYKWFLKLPGIYYVTDHYTQLISHIVFLQLGNNQYGLGFLTGFNNTKYIAFSRSYNSIKRVIIRKHSKIERGDNILEFSLQQQSSDKFHLLPRAQQAYTSLFGLNSFTIQDNQVQYYFQSTVHASGYVNQSVRSTFGEISGLKVILKKQNHLWKLVFEPFEAKDIFNNIASSPPAFYFVYDFKNKVLIWAFK